MSFTTYGDEYIGELSRLAKSKLSRTEQIAQSIAQNGFWEDFQEWRISTVTEMRIEPIEINGHKYYRVRVKCDSEHTCFCPTIERAAEFLGMFERFVADLWTVVGWPSWATKAQMIP